MLTDENGIKIFEPEDGEINAEKTFRIMNENFRIIAKILGEMKPEIYVDNQRIGIIPKTIKDGDLILGGGGTI